MQIYNAGGLDNNQRFIKAILIGIASAVCLGLVYGVILGFVHIEMEIIYIFIGWCIGSLIQKFSHGVGTRYCVTGALCTFLAILIGDICAMYGVANSFAILFNPSLWPAAVTMWAQMNLSTNINNLLGIAFRIVGIYFGYHNSSLF